MSLKQCSGCAVMVDEAKAFCASCGNPMDEEQKRTDSSEFEALAKTQNLNSTKHLEILEQFNLSMIFAASPKNLPSAPEAEAEPPTSPTKSLNDNQVRQPDRVYELPTWNLAAQQKEIKSNNKIYLIIGAILIVLLIILIVGIIAYNFISQAS